MNMPGAVQAGTHFGMGGDGCGSNVIVIVRPGLRGDV